MASTGDKPVLLVGDIIFDVHHFGTGGGISREAPIPVGTHERTEKSWGGAGLVARNILALEKPVIFFSIIGRDEYGRELEAFSDKNLTKHFVVDPKRQTIVKERFLINGEKVLRWNRGDSTPLSPELEAKMFEAIKEVMSACDKVLISDYRHGCLSEALAAKIIKEAHAQGKLVYADSQVTRTEANHEWYRGADVVCLNQTEALAVDPSFSDTDKALPQSLVRLQKMLEAQNIIIKLAERGSAALIDGEYMLVPAKKVAVVDSTGAGDAFFAALGSQGGLSKEAVQFANDWGALAVTVEGTNPPNLSQLK